MFICMKTIQMNISHLRFGSVLFLVCFMLGCQPVVSNNDHAWEEQGPFKIINGQVEGLPERSVIGAVSSVAPDPENSDILVIGAVNGGIWKTENARDIQPDWVPVDDQLPSMSISCMTRDLFNPDILYAGIGARSSFGSSGPTLGMLRSTDRGNSWVNNSVGLTTSLLDIAVGLYNPANDDNRTIYAATNAGLFRAYDGVNFALVTAIPGSTVSDIHCDEKGEVVIVAVPGDSVYLSRDFGLTFIGLDIDFSNDISIKLAVATNKLFIASTRANNENAFINIVALDNLSVQSFLGPVTLEGITFTSRGPFPATGRQSQLHFSFIAKQYNSNTVDLFLGGVSNQDLILGSTGQGTFSGRVFQGIHNADLNTLVWSPVVGNGANGTAPHADSRSFAFDKEENLIQVNDGGIYKLFSPHLLSPERKWVSLNGDLRISEVISVAYDSRNNTIIAGLQDNGSVEQTASVFEAGEITWTAARQWTFFGVDLLNAVGDGYSVNVDNQHDPSTRYIMLNHLGLMFKRDYASIQPPFVGAPWDHFQFNNGCILPVFCFLNAADQADISSGRVGVIPFELNALDQSRFVIGGNGIYKLMDRGNDIRLIDTGSVQTQCIDYGSRDNAEVVYYVKQGDPRIHQQFETGDTWLRRQFPGALDIAIDVQNGNHVFYITNNNVFQIRNFWPTGDQEDLTFNLAAVSGNVPLSVISVIEVTVPGNPSQQLILVGGRGGVFVLLNFGNMQRWTELGTGIPNVNISEIRYNVEDDILVMGTIGRGTWVMKSFSEKIPFLANAFD